MIPPDRLWAGRSHHNLWIFILLFAVSEGRHYDKCFTKDGRQGVCVVKRYCREASQHELLPCERDDENHCCPIVPSQRSAPTSPPPERSWEEDTYIPEPEENRKRPGVFRESDRDDRLNKTPPPADRRPPARHNNDRPREQPSRDRTDERDADKHNPYEPRENPRDPPERARPPARNNNDRSREQPSRERTGGRDADKHNPYEPRENPRDPPERARPPARNDNDRPREQPSRERTDGYDADKHNPYEPRENPRDPPERGRPPARYNNDRPRERPSADRTDERDADRHSPYEPRENPRDPPERSRDPPERSGPPARHNSERPKERPRTDNRDEYDDDRRLPYDPQESPRDRPERPRPNPDSRPSVRPTDYDQRDPPSRQPDRDRFYPEHSDPPRRNRDRRPEVERDIVGSANPPRKVNNDREPDRRNRTTEDSSMHPVRFPNNYESSVPRPKVPACGVKPYDLFIAGGQESVEHEWPWMTAIFRRYTDSRPKTFLCGGSLINTKYILTAAHCLINNYAILPASSFVIRLGSHFLNSGDDYTVSNLVIHHNHSGMDYFNDIALVRLASEAYITDKIAPICLPYPEMVHDDFVGKLATVAGWGDTAFRTSGTRILQHVTVPIVSGEECLIAYSRVQGAAFLARGSDHVICAGLREGGKDACLGDSGGPLMMKMPDERWIIIGIVSLGYKCAEPGFPGVYTRVTHYMSWINTNMKRH